jgi:hypothetical protein
MKPFAHHSNDRFSLSPESAEVRALTAVNFVNFAAVLEGRAA